MRTNLIERHAQRGYDRGGFVGGYGHGLQELDERMLLVEGRLLLSPQAPLLVSLMARCRVEHLELGNPLAERI
jgi:hypothetical protein